MSLSAQLDIETATGDGDTSVGIDPAFWSANQSTIQGYAAAAGVTLYFQDPKLSATSISANVQTLADVKAQIDEASRISVTSGAGGGIKGAAPAASSGATLGGQSSGAGPALVLGFLGFVVAVVAAADST